MTITETCASSVQEAPNNQTPVDLEKSTKSRDNECPRLTPDQQALAMHYLPLARQLAKPFKAAWTAYWDDFESAACLGLVNAAQTYDASKRVKFSTYARKRILGELRDVKRDMQLSGWRDSEDPPTVCHLGYEQEGDGRVLCTTAQQPVDKEFAARDIADHWLAKLPKPHAAACRLIIIEELTHRQTGAALGRSKSRVQRLHAESLSILNESFRWKNMNAHEDDLIKAPLTPREKINPERPELPDVLSADQSPPEIVKP